MQKYFSRGAPHERTRELHEPRPDKRPGRSQPAQQQPPLASAIRLKNIRQLAAVAGDENLALALDLPIQRVRELLEGLNFTDEMAFHLETTLGLRSGFLDQVNPQLSDINLNRLKDPLTAMTEVAGTDALGPTELSSQPGIAPPAQAPSISNETEVNQEASVAQARTESAPKVTTKPVRRVKDIEKLREIRRQNLAMLTTPSGSKSKLARIAGLTPAGLSHRLHGHQHFDDDSAELFIEKLGLPPAWFDVPRSESDVPAEVQALLVDESSSSARSTSRSHRSTGRPRGRPRATLVNEPARDTAPPAPLPPAASEMPPSLRSATLNPAPMGAAPAPMPRQAAVPAPARRAAAPAPAYAAPAAQAASMSRQAPLALETEEYGSLGPIAEALVKTLALKSRQGRLTEAVALKMHNESMAL
jgi:hypothetical protein